MTSLTTTFHDAATTIRAAFGDVFETVDWFVLDPQPDLDTETGVVIHHDPGGAVGTAPMAIGPYRAAERAATGIPGTDLKGIVAGDDAPVTPAVGLLLRRADGTVWEAIDVQTPVTGAVHVVQLRRSTNPWPV